MRADAAATALRDLKGRYGPREARRKKRLLAAIAQSPPRDAATLLALHDLLLFMAAHPDDASVRRAVERELGRLSSAAGRIERLPRQAAALLNSGIGGTTVHGSFSFDALAWLARRYPHDTALSWTDDDHVELDGLIESVLSPLERDAFLADGVSTRQLVRLAGGGRRTGDLGWLLDSIARLSLPVDIRDRAFEALQLFVDWRLRRRSASIAGARFPPRPPFFFRQRGPSWSLQDLLRRPLPLPGRLPLAGRAALLDACRACLLARHRETDAVTHGSPDDVELMRLERGLDVALLGAEPARRLPIESFVGFIIARNRVPIGYGGAWLFFSRAEIGIHIFEPFRGGESAFAFAQLLRVYHRRFGAARFLVDPFQFGADNEEAIRSGAYWFYHRLGFRPQDPGLAALATAEDRRLTTDRRYRSPPRVLRRLAGAMLELRIDETHRADPPDLHGLALAVMDLVARRFQGDRRTATQWAQESVRRSLGMGTMADWTGDERRGFAAWAPLIALIEDLDAWSAAEKRALASILRAKGGRRQRPFIQGLQRHRRLFDALTILSARGDSVRRRIGARPAVAPVRRRA